MNASERGSDLGTRPSYPPEDPVEGRSDGELWKRHRPTGDAPARSGWDQEVGGGATAVDMEACKAEVHDRPAPGMLDIVPSVPQTQRHQEDEQEVRGLLDPISVNEEDLHQQRRSAGSTREHG